MGMAIAGEGGGARQPLRTLLALLVALAIPALPTAAQEVDAQRVAQVKAAYLVNFLRYTQWPASAFASPETSFRVTVIGDDAVARELDTIARRGTLIGGRRVSVVHAELPESGPDGALGSHQREHFYSELGRTHLLYIGSGAGAHVAAILRGVAQYDALTVGDTQGFAASGGMIGLVLVGRRMLFDANPAAIQRTGLRVSAKLLKLARVVRGGAPG